jgi:N-acetylneuraminic acid mutarotase
MIGKDFVIASGFFETVKQATNQTYALDTSDPNATWRRMDDLPIALGVTHAPAVIVGTKMYMIGGYLGGNLGEST